MRELTTFSIVEQVASHLREEILQGQWSGTIPGRGELAADLGMNTTTVEAALRLLEKEGLLVGQGAGRRRKIVLPEDYAPPALRVAVLFYEKGDEVHDLHIRLQMKLTAAGHTVVHARKNLTDIGRDMRRLARMIKDTDADAWVVTGGSKEVLRWFVQRQIPVFALYGDKSQLRIAGIGLNMQPAIVVATRRLIALGHRRIVMLESGLTLSDPAPSSAAFIDEMTAHGITVGNYNLPGWEGGLEGIYNCLESLFARTPPTALFLHSAAEYFATAQFLLHRGLQVPGDVSLVCMDQAPYFNRFQPPISHVRWNDQLMVNRIVRWANNISHGKEDTRQTTIDAEFVEGGTVGRAP